MSFFSFNPKKSIVKREARKNGYMKNKKDRSTNQIRYYKDGTTTGFKSIDNYFTPAPDSMNVTLIIPESVKMYINTIVDKNDVEVGFMGVLDINRDDNNQLQSITLKEVLYPKHIEQHGATCVFEDGDLIERVLYNTPDGNPTQESAEKSIKITYYGHSHHTMGVSPSGQDDNKFLEMIGRPSIQEPAGNVWVRGIHNKKGDIRLDIVDCVNMLYYKHQNISIINSNDVYNEDDISSIRSILDDDSISIEERIKIIKEYQSPLKSTLEKRVDEEMEKYNAEKLYNYNNQSHWWDDDYDFEWEHRNNYKSIVENYDDEFNFNNQYNSHYSDDGFGLMTDDEEKMALYAEYADSRLDSDDIEIDSVEDISIHNDPKFHTRLVEDFLLDAHDEEKSYRFGLVMKNMIYRLHHIEQRLLNNDKEFIRYEG